MTEQEKKNGVVQPQQQQQPQAPTQEQINASAANSASKGASSTTGFTYNGFQGVSSQHDQQHVTDANDLARIEQLSAQAKYANAMGDAATVAKVHAEAEAIRNKYNYTGDVNDRQGYEYAALPQNNGGVTTPKIQPYSYTPQFGDALDRWYAAAQAQQMGQVDYATNTGVNELVRAEQDAQAQFQTQRNQIAIDEAKAKDNQALYAEARGDKGGIGAAQYDSIMNTAAQNRLAVNSAQTKLATDTSRQIADLRAKGEFEKADALLTLSQQYLSQLISLEQWAAEFGLSVAQFNASLQQWEAEFELAVGETMGSYQGKPTLGAQQFQFNQQQYADELAMTQKNQLSEDGWLFLQSGIMPSASQLEAMGMTASQAQTVLTSQALAAKSSSSSGGGNPKNDSKEKQGSGINDLFYDAARYAKDGGLDPWGWIKNNYKKYGLTAQPTSSAWESYYKNADKGGMSDGEFNKLGQTLSQMFQQSMDSDNYKGMDPLEYVASIEDRLSLNQKLRLEDLFNKYGLEI